MYLFSPEQLTPEAPPGTNIYRYEISGETLRFVVQQVGNPDSDTYFTSPDGRYLYFQVEAVEGLPGGAWCPAGGVNNPGSVRPSEQVYRFDSAENVVQCMSCASSFDPEPKLAATFGKAFGVAGGVLAGGGGLPDFSVSSANGDFVFFDTPAALVKQDVDGEVVPKASRGLGKSDLKTLAMNTRHRVMCMSGVRTVSRLRERAGLSGFDHVRPGWLFEPVVRYVVFRAMMCLIYTSNS